MFKNFDRFIVFPLYYIPKKKYPHPTNEDAPQCARISAPRRDIGFYNKT